MPGTGTRVDPDEIFGGWGQWLCRSRRVELKHGTEVLLAAHLALNQASESSNLSGPTENEALVV